jgi:hypothetical protein
MMAWIRTPAGIWSCIGLAVLLLMPAILPEFMPANQANF